jgi:hypothetical protein
MHSGAMGVDAEHKPSRRFSWSKFKPRRSCVDDATALSCVACPSVLQFLERMAHQIRVEQGQRAMVVGLIFNIRIYQEP